MSAPPPPGATVPWVIGQWVRGERFYGRERELATLGGAPGGSFRGGAGARLWVAGLRRIGKTSLLRQLELLALEGAAGSPPALPIYWDLEGVDGPGELALALDDALLDAGDGFERLGLDPPAPGGGDDPAALLDRLGAEVAASGAGRRDAGLVLLCDEADRLAALAGSHPGLVRRLWRAAAGAGRVVIASSVRLADLAAGGDPGAAETVEGFGGPQLLGAMPPAEARELVRQIRLPETARPDFDDATVEAIRETCGDHPMLLQLAGRRCQETGDAGAALHELAADRTVGHLFEVDLALLTGAERRALRTIAVSEVDAGHDPGVDPDQSALRRLLALGLLRRSRGRIAIHNRLLAAWLGHEPAAAGSLE